MTYSGKYKVKNTKKYKGDFLNVVYRSNWEKQVFIWCDKTPEIIEWSSEEVVIPYFYDVDKKYHRYFMDLKIKTKDGKVRLIEIKPKKQTAPPARKNTRTKQYMSEALTYVKNQNKWNAAEKFAKDNGWTFEIWTEDTLKEMGILKSLTRKKKRTSRAKR